MSNIPESVIQWATGGGALSHFFVDENGASWRVDNEGKLVNGYKNYND